MRRVDQRVEQDTAHVTAVRVAGGPPSPGLLAAGNQAVARAAGSAEPHVFAQRWGPGSMISSVVDFAGDVLQGVFGQDIRGSVGVEGANDPGDVMVVMRLLSGAGYADTDIGAAITRFQTEVVKLPKPDGRVDPKGRTLTALKRHQPKHKEKQDAAGPHPAAPAPVIQAGDVENWPAVLPTAKRSAEDKTNITLKRGESQVTIPEIDTPELTGDQKSLVDKIRANREAITANPKLKMTNYYGKNKKLRPNKGMVYGDSQGKENLTPSSLQGDDPKAKAMKIAYKELGTEGKVNSINTYDDQIVTWGKGFSAHSGSLNKVFMILFRDHPELRLELLRAGIDCTPKTWNVVNTGTGMIETGDNALRLMQFDTKMLTALIDIGAGDEREQWSIDAQWEAMSSGGAASVPEYAYDWGESAIALAAHLAHWTPAFGWKSHPKLYEKTDGDLVEMAGTWARLAARHPTWKRSVPTLKNGAIITPGDMMAQGHRLRGFAGGAGGDAVESRATQVTGTRAEIEDSQYAGHVLIPHPTDKDKYYDIGNAGS